MVRSGGGGEGRQKTTHERTRDASIGGTVVSRGASRRGLRRRRRRPVGKRSFAEKALFAEIRARKALVQYSVVFIA